MSKQLVIVACSDPLMWYRDLVGTAVPLLREMPSDLCWLSRDGGGFTNVVKHSDAVPMPSGYRQLKPDELLSHKDFVLGPGQVTQQWHVAAFDQIGTAVGDRLALRATKEPKGTEA